MSESVTIQITKESHYEWNVKSPFKIGSIIKMKGQKRFCYQIKDRSKEHTNQHTISMVIVYKPAPKSKLNHKTIFSKAKCKIV